MDKILIIVPIYNEEENIKEVINEVEKELPNMDLLVVNDSSTDKSLEILKEMKVNYLDLPINLGYCGALQAGFKYALLHEYDYVVQFDGDRQHIALEVNKLYNKIIEKNLDIVIGSRYIGDSLYKQNFARKVGTNIFSKIIKISCKQKITDPTSGFQILNKKAYSLYSKINEYPRYPDANLIIDMIFRGYSIAEVPVNMRYRELGNSMHRGIIKPIKYMIEVLYSITMVITRKRGYR